MTEWLRVTKQRRCPICGKDSWCLIHEKDNVCICMRVASDHYKQFSSGEIGYLHGYLHTSNGDVGTRRVTRQDKQPEPVINVGKLLDDWFYAAHQRSLAELSERIDVPVWALGRLGCVWSSPNRAWAFPMRDGFNNFTGIRLRSDDGAKWAVRGSHQGIFLPQCDPKKMAMVCEGPTDTAAALALGFFAVGRPSCSGGMQHVQTAFRRLRVTRAVIVADNDDPGLNGAQILANQLAMPTCILVLPAKDVRDFVKFGGSRYLMDSMINQCVWRQAK